MDFRCTVLVILCCLASIRGLKLPEPSSGLLEEKEIDGVSGSSSDLTKPQKQPSKSAEASSESAESSSKSAESSSESAESSSESAESSSESAKSSSESAESPESAESSESAKASPESAESSSDEVSSDLDPLIQDQRIYGMNIGLHYILEGINTKLAVGDKVHLEPLIKVLVMTHKIEKVNGTLNESNKNALKNVAELFPDSLKEAIALQ